MGIPIVEGRDLVVRDSKVYMRTTAGLVQVDVIYRRIDDDFLDPTVFRADSMLGVPGLIGAARAGHVALANSVGTGVATTRSSTPTSRDHRVLPRRRLCSTTSTPTSPPSRSTGNSSSRNLQTRREVSQRGRRLRRCHRPGRHRSRVRELPHSGRRRTHATSSPRDPISLSRSPTYCDGELQGRHIDLRPYILRQESHRHPGGLTRVALRKGSLVVDSFQGGGSQRDTSVLQGDEQRPPLRAHACPCRQSKFAYRKSKILSVPPAAKLPPSRRQTNVMLSRVAHSLYWMSRYIERAENMARLLEVNLQFLLDFQGLNDSNLKDHWDSIILSTRRRETLRGTLQERRQPHGHRILAFDLRNPGSILSCVFSARENARMIRDQISAEMSETLNELYLYLKSQNTTEVWAVGTA